PPAAGSPTTRTFAVTSGTVARPQRIVIYGTGGIGKSSCAALAPRPVFLDLEHGTSAMDVPRIDGLETYADVRACLQSSVFDGYDTLVVDSGTKLEELIPDHVMATVPTERGQAPERLQDYGFGKEMGHIYDAYLLILQDLDHHIRAGRHVVMICHDCVNDVPNPQGENFIRFEPRLQSPKSGKASIRHRVIEWADHVLFLGYDVAATKAGKGIGAGTRTIYPTERPDHIAKSRTLPDAPIVYANAQDGAVWDLIFGGATK
ncbi:MAG: ATP-binding protein, partial [Candidatus Omnitrophota bacterium]|nr:ATP-binding protein [Candidatus Omnitrophota bacterium]